MKHYKKIFYLLLCWLTLFVAEYFYFFITDESVECLTDNICLSTKNSPALLAMAQSSLIMLLIFVAFFTSYLMMLAWLKGFAIYLGAGLMILLGGGGVATLIAVTPKDELLDFIHIIIIGSFFILLGIFMLYKTLQKRKS